MEFSQLLNLAKLFYFVFEAFLELIFPISWIRKVQYPVRGKIALVTGAANGIGRETTLKLAKGGCTVVLVDVNEDGMREVAEQAKKLGKLCHCFVCDISKKEEVKRVAEEVESKVGPVDILINNAGIVVTSPLIECKDAEIERTLQINLIAHFWTIRAFLPGMMRRKSGHIVSISSFAGLIGTPHSSIYCTSKFGVVGLHESMRNEIELAGLGDKVGMTCVCPGVVKTRMTKEIRDTNMNLGMPVLDPEELAMQIVEAIEYRREMLLAPGAVRIAAIVRASLPMKALVELNKLAGMEKLCKMVPKCSTIELLPKKYQEST